MELVILGASHRPARRGIRRNVDDEMNARLGDTLIAAERVHPLSASADLFSPGNAQSLPRCHQ